MLNEILYCENLHQKDFEAQEHKRLKSNSLSTAMAQSIFLEIMKFCRMIKSKRECTEHNCKKCLQPHFLKILSIIEQSKPIEFVLPAFPGKPPNPSKVLGVLPDRAEMIALEFLQGLCDRVKQLYSPGAQLILCSDGRVFNDIIGMKDEEISSYQSA